MSDKSKGENQAENLLRAMSDHSGADTHREDDSHRKDIVASVRMDHGHDQLGTHTRGGNAPAPRSRETYDDTSPRDTASDPVVDYDFRQQAPVCRDQLCGLHTMSGQVAERFGASLDEMMRGDATLQLRGVDQTTHQEIVHSLANPCCFSTIDISPLKGRWAVSVDQALTFAMIDRMLGGEPSPNETISRAMTDIESQLMRRVIEAMLEEVVAGWSKLVSLSPTIESIKSASGPLESLGTNAVVLKVHFDITICTVRGSMCLWMPVETIDHLGPRLAEDHWSDKSAEPSEATRQVMASQLGHAPVDVVVNLASSKITTGDLLNLSVGDVIATEKESESPLELTIQNVVKFTARAGAYQGKKAVKIERAVE